MFAIRSAWQRTRVALVSAAMAIALVPPGALAQEAIGELRAVPSALLSIDQNRPVVIERIVEVFRPAFGPGQEATVREALAGMRADQLLAASLAPNLDGLLAVMKSTDSASPANPRFWSTALQPHHETPVKCRCAPTSRMTITSAPWKR